MPYKSSDYFDGWITYYLHDGRAVDFLPEQFRELPEETLSSKDNLFKHYKQQVDDHLWDYQQAVQSLHQQQQDYQLDKFDFAARAVLVTGMPWSGTLQFEEIPIMFPRKLTAPLNAPGELTTQHIVDLTNMLADKFETA